MSTLEVVDGMAWVRAHPERFFLDGVPTALELAKHLLCDVAYRDVECCILRSGSWWIVMSPSDWMASAGCEVAELFTRIVPAPEQGPNSMRGEVVVAAYAASYATFDGVAWNSDLVPEAVQTIVDARPEIRRAVAFRMS